MPGQDVKRVLGIDPFSRGVGFAVLEGPDNLVDWGLKATGKADNGKAVRVIEGLIKRFQPDLLALEDWDAAGARRCQRVERLLSRIAASEGKHIRVCLINQRHLRMIGPLPHVSTKSGRAGLLAERFPELQPFLPPFRKLWMPEADRMAIFDAVSFAVSCFPPKLEAPATKDQPAVKAR
jgi:hypothetical protein